jgi:hypothetical protein
LENEELLTSEELEPELKVTVEAVYQLVRRKVIPHVRLNHKILRFRLSEVREALQNYHVPAKPLTRLPFPKRKEEGVK